MENIINLKNEEIKKTIEEFYVTGKLSREDICERYEISQRTFERRLKELGYSRKTHIRTSSGIYIEKNNITFWRKLYNEYLKGASLKDLDTKYKVNHMTIAKQFRHFNFEFKSKDQINEQRISKRKKTCLERFGTEHHFQNEEVLAKYKSTLRSKYGVDNVMKLESSQEKAKKTKNEKK